MLQKQGSVNPDGTPVRAARQAPAPKTAAERVSVGPYVAEVRSELKKVAWPTRETVVKLTLIVIAVSIAVGIYIAVLDAVLHFGVEQIL